MQVLKRYLDSPNKYLVSTLLQPYRRVPEYKQSLVDFTEGRMGLHTGDEKEEVKTTGTMLGRNHFYRFTLFLNLHFASVLPSPRTCSP